MSKLRPQFKDEKACPYCGGLVERWGTEKADYRLLNAQGRPEWTWAPAQLRTLPPRDKRPEYDGQRWTQHSTIHVDVGRGGVEVEKQKIEWEFLSDYICHECNYIFQACDVKEFVGDYPDWAIVQEGLTHPDLERLKRELQASMTEPPSAALSVDREESCS